MHTKEKPQKILRLYVVGEGIVWFWGWYCGWEG